MSDYPIPNEALDDRLGFVGTAGSGKTYNSGSGVERVLASGGRVVIPDPLGVWWGMALASAGDRPSAWRDKGRLVIFGGEHGDLPLNEHAGALVGEAVAGMAESAILDLSGMGTKAAERRFMLAFLTAFYRHASGDPVHLIFDEADMWAPQRLLDKDGEAAKLLGMMETVVRRGRIKGFIPWLITQRPAVLSKDVLSQVDGLVAFKLTSSQDRAALGAWIEGQADMGQGREILASLPTLQRGTGVVWMPGRGILETADFPAKVTFDSSRTPKRGERQERRDLKALDLGKLKERLASVEQEAKANDPKALKAEVARLTRELAKSESGKHIVAAPTWPDQREEVAALLHDLERSMAREADLVNRQQAALAALGGEGVTIPAPAPRQARPAPAPAPVQRQPIPVRVPRQGAGDGALTGPQRHLLTAMAWWLSMGHDCPTRVQVAAKAGWAPKGSNLRNRLSELSAAGLVEYPRTGLVRLTSTGLTAAPAPNLSETLIECIVAILTGPQQAIFNVLHTVRGTVNRATLAEALGWEAGGSNLRNRLSELSALELVEYPGRGEVRLQAWVTADG